MRVVPRSRSAPATAGHAELVQPTLNRQMISIREILLVFFTIHLDPPMAHEGAAVVLADIDEDGKR